MARVVAMGGYLGRNLISPQRWNRGHQGPSLVGPL